MADLQDADAPPVTVDADTFLARGRGVLATQPFSVWLGAELAALAPGRCELALDLRPEHLQQHGFAHGGVVSYLADNAITFAGGTALRAPVVTSEYKVNYVRPGVGRRLVARAEALHAGRSQVVCRCEVYAVDADGSERLCALAQGTIARLGEASSEKTA